MHAFSPPFSLREGLRPVVVLGAGRSGTKFLRRLIAASSACTSIPYGANHAWRTGNEGHPDDALPAAACTPRIARRIRKALLRLARNPSRPPVRYLVEKTCANTLRVEFVARVLPDARYVYIVRDGRDAVASAFRRWNAPPDLWDLLDKLRYLLLSNPTPSSLRFVGWYASNWLRGLLKGNSRFEVWGPRYPGIYEDLERLSPLEVCARQWRTCVERAERALQALPSERVLRLRYEELVSSPTVVDEICSFLQLPDSEAVRRYYHRTVRRDAVGKGARTLSARQMETILPIIEPVLKRSAYR